jgi:hypothetical protein
MEEQSSKAEDAVDNLFTEILANDVGRTEHYQAKLDFLFEKLEQHPALLGYKAYKVHVAQAYVYYQQQLLSDALSNLQAAETLLGDHQMQKPYARADEKITGYIRAYVKKDTRTQAVKNVKNTAVRTFLASLGFFAVGGILTGITYSLAKPGSTYLVTSGLFIVGAFNLLVSIINFFKWMGMKAIHR